MFTMITCISTVYHVDSVINNTGHLCVPISVYCDIKILFVPFTD